VSTPHPVTPVTLAHSIIIFHVLQHHHYWLWEDLYSGTLPYIYSFIVERVCMSPAASAACPLVRLVFHCSQWWYLCTTLYYKRIWKVQALVLVIYNMSLPRDEDDDDGDDDRKVGGRHKSHVSWEIVFYTSPRLSLSNPRSTGKMYMYVCVHL
jgi:hypothetical protein